MSSAVARSAAARDVDGHAMHAIELAKALGAGKAAPLAMQSLHMLAPASRAQACQGTGMILLSKFLTTYGEKFLPE